ncbi:MAG: zinc ribbon domain-containing protein [Dysgonamonadaceae bacterium]|nr:zinc ribbon domain-containing protein [Dysgonamonadaceae bacterium]
MFCENCGKEIPNDSRFCEYCGASLAAAPTVTTTPPPSPASTPPSAQPSSPPPPPSVKAPEIPDKPIIPVKESPAPESVETETGTGSDYDSYVQLKQYFDSRESRRQLV